MKMPPFELSCTKVTNRDDRGKIARYLHLTDPYIYPAICSDPDAPAWVELITACLADRSNVYSADHLSVIKCDGEIIGVTCVIPCGSSLRFSQGIPCADSLKKGIALTEKGYFQPLIQESLAYEGFNIVNFCVDEAYRGKGVGSRLMTYLTESYGIAPIHLDVVADNAAAIRLYEKFGFSVTEAYQGFSGSNTLLPCYHMLRPSRA